MSFDLIVTWPDSMDYPIFRQFLVLNRAKFQKVLIPVMKANRPRFYNYIPFLKETMAEFDITWVEDYPVTNDWRDAGVNAALAKSEASHVWFTEQDFFIKDSQEFYNKILDGLKITDMIVFRDNLRMHPALMVIKRELISKTSRDFGIVEGKLDHFGKFSMECVDITKVHPVKNRVLALQEVGLIETRDYYHMDGLTHNYHLVQEKSKENIYKPAEFMLYNSYARLSPVVQNPEFINLTFEADQLIAPITKFFLGMVGNK